MFPNITAHLENTHLSFVPNRELTTCQWGEAKSSLATFLAAALEALLWLILRWQTGHITSDLFIAASKQAASTTE